MTSPLGPFFSKRRKVLWIVNFAFALVSAPGCFVDGVAPNLVIQYAAIVTINLFACWVSFDSTWEKVGE